MFVIGTSERSFGWEKERERVLTERAARYSRHDDRYTRGTECRLRGAPPALKRFIEGVRYYLNTLEDEDAWWHSLGHIEELCKEFDQAVKARSEASK